MPRNDLNTEGIVSGYLKGVSAGALARQHQCSVWTIMARLRKRGVRIRGLKEQCEKRINLTPQQTEEFQAIVDGILLGDGYIHRKGGLYIEQSHPRTGWLREINDKFGAMGVQSRIISIPPRQRYLDGRCIRSKGGALLYTPCYVEMQVQRCRWYPKGKKSIPLDIELTPLTLAYWLAGDGTRGGNGLTFYTNSFSKKEVAGLVDRLNRKLNVTARVGSAGRPREYVVWLHCKADAVKFKGHIAEYIPACCQYKVAHI